MDNPPQHQFIVFSIIGDDNVVKPKFAQCPNCGIVHHVIEFSKSEVVPRESMTSIVTIEDIKLSLPEQLVTILSKYDADLPTWEAVQFIYDEKQWGNFVVLSTDVEGDLKQGKYIRILGEQSFKVESFVRSEIINDKQ